MSEKYSADVLVKFIADSKIDITDDRCFAIIARLRAGDRLCEAAKGVMNDISLYDYEEAYQKFCKAIADYEGKP